MVPAGPVIGVLRLSSPDSIRLGVSLLASNAGRDLQTMQPDCRSSLPAFEHCLLSKHFPDSAARAIA
jgi:hypothetical protein